MVTREKVPCLTILFQKVDMVFFWRGRDSIFFHVYAGPSTPLLQTKRAEIQPAGRAEGTHSLIALLDQRADESGDGATSVQQTGHSASRGVAPCQTPPVVLE